MKIYCSICATSFTEIPDDAELGPEFQFRCKNCCPPGNRVQGFDVAHDPPRPGRPSPEFTSACTTVEEFLGKITTIARAYAREYDLPLDDCISEGKVALKVAEADAKRNGKPLTTKDAGGIVRRAIFRFAERELKERGLARKDDPKRPGKKRWVPLRYVVSMDEELDTEDNEDAVLRCEVEAVPTLADSPEEQAIAQERQRQVKVAIQGLPPLQRKVLFLLYDEGLTVREAAFVLRMSKSDVWRISAEAKAAIATKLGTKSKIAPIDNGRDAMRQSEQKLAA